MYAEDNGHILKFVYIGGNEGAFMIIYIEGNISGR